MKVKGTIDDRRAVMAEVELNYDLVYVVLFFHILFFNMKILIKRIK